MGLNYFWAEYENYLTLTDFQEHSVLYPTTPLSTVLAPEETKSLPL